MSRVYLLCFWVVLLEVVLAPVEYLATLNAYGSSTDYFNQYVASAEHGPNGQDFVTVGDDFLVRAEIIRHRVNGTCQLSVNRVRENVGGRLPGAIHLIQHVDQNFVGDGAFRYTSWPIPPAKIVVGDDWIEPGAAQQVIDVFVVGRYYCNVLDRVFPRFLRGDDGGDPGRHQVGFDIPGWDSQDHEEGNHSRVTVKRR